MQQERTLAAIMFTDIVGYTSLMENNEDEALHALEINRQLISSAINQHHGQWIKEIGDATLSTFHSTLDALNCAFKILKLIADYPNLNLRIALHLGDIVQEEHDIYGDGVNIASRLQHLDPVNGIAISEHFNAQIQGKSNSKFQSIGFPTLKNIKANIEVFIWDQEHKAPYIYANNNVAKENSKKTGNISPKWINITALSIILMAVFISYFYQQNDAVSPQKSFDTTINPINKNSIAVLKFKNIGESNNSYFNEGLSEELLNLLARMKELKVASRTSTWSLPDNINATDVRKKLNVNYMVEGSVRKSNNRIRITAQLINTQTGFHLWSETYDREMTDIIAIQDEIADKVTQSLKILLSAQSRKSISSPKKINALAYDYYLKAKNHLRQPRTLTSLNLSQQYFNKALALDNSLLLAIAGLCQNQIEVYRITLKQSDFDSAEKNCTIILKSNSYKTEMYTAIGNLYLVSGRYEDAEKSFNAALTLDLNSIDALLGLGQTLNVLNKQLQAEQYFKRAIQTEPNYTKTYEFYASYLYKNGNYEKAISQFRKAIVLGTEKSESYNGLGGSYFAIGDLESGINAFEQSLNIRKSKEAYSNLGTAYFMKKQFSRSAKMYENAIELAPNDYRFVGFLAETYEQLPDKIHKATSTYQKAITLAEKTLNINSNDTVTSSSLAMYYAKTGKNNKALNLLKKLSNQDLDANLLYLNGVSYLTTGKTELAVKTLIKAVSKGYPRELLKVDNNFTTLKKTKNLKP